MCKIMCKSFGRQKPAVIEAIEYEAAEKRSGDHHKGSGWFLHQDLTPLTLAAAGPCADL